MQYVSGATQILPGSSAAYDACDRMGDRKYFDIVVGDIERQTPIADKRLVRISPSAAVAVAVSSMRAYSCVRVLHAPCSCTASLRQGSFMYRRRSIKQATSL